MQQWFRRLQQILHANRLLSLCLGDLLLQCRLISDDFFVGFLVDGAVDWIMRQAGYDPAGDIAREVSSTLGRMETLLIEGEPEAHRAFKKLRHLQDHDRFSFVRTECRQSADGIEASGILGLRHELDRLHTLRSRLREEALKKLVLEGGTP